MVATDPTGWTSHTDDFHRGMTWKLAVRAATTASITISTALNNGDVLDGVTLATGDRVLVKDQATGSQNGIYIVSASPARAPDMDQDSTTAVPSQEVLGAVVIVFSGTVNGGTMWRNTNTTAPTLGTTALTFAQIGGVSAGAVTTSGLTMATARLLGRTTAATGAIEEITVGSGLTLSAGSLTASGGSGTVTTVEEVDGTPTDSAVTKIVFPNGTLAIAAHVATYTPAGGGGTTIQYPGLRPATPTYDFAGSSLDAAFAAHSSQGTFALANVFTQGEDWQGSSVELQFSEQMGAIYVTHSNTDFDFTVGGIRSKGLGTAALGMMYGIAALNSAGTGVGIVLYQNDGTAYIASITTWSYGAQSDSFAQHGLGIYSTVQGDYWLRLKRVGSTWTGYISVSGRAWDKTFATRSDSITVDRLVFGLLYNSASSYSGRLMADYFQVDV